MPELLDPDDYLGPLVSAAAQLVPYVHPAITGYLASYPSQAEARDTLKTLHEIRDMIQTEADRVSAYLQAGGPDAQLPRMKLDRETIERMLGSGPSLDIDLPTGSADA